MALCIKGKVRNVSITYKDIWETLKRKPNADDQEDGDKKSFYERYTDHVDDVTDSVLFPYGKGLGKTIGNMPHFSHKCYLCTCSTAIKIHILNF